MKYWLILFVLSLASCHSHDHEGEGGHNHGHDAHEAGEFPRISKTIWDGDYEFFVDFDALVVGRVTQFAAHFTLLGDHQPLSDGSLEVRLSKTEDGGEQGSGAAQAGPKAPGLFTPSITPGEAGKFNLVFTLDDSDAERRFVVRDVQVFADEDSAIHGQDAEENGSSTITFLKEQAWKIDFGTKQAVNDEIYEVVYSSGVWKTAPGATKSIVATVSGLVDFKSRKLTDGGRVAQGQHLLSISSDQLTHENIGVEVEQALSVFEQAEAEYERKKELYESRIIPRAEFEVVESRYRIAKSDYESLLRGYSSGTKVITAPFTGYIRSVDIQNGDFVTEGDKLISLATDRSKILESHVSPAYAVSEKDIRNIWYQPRPNVWSSLNESGGSLLSVSEQVSADHPMAAVFAQVNEEVQMPSGGFSEVQIALGDVEESILVPESALLEDYGNFSVIVQLGGETFERRPVKTGRRNGDQVEITRGLSEGEWVVTQGAYQVKMASMSGELPAHGHEH